MNMGINVRTDKAGGPVSAFAELGHGTKAESSGFADAFDKALMESRNAASKESQKTAQKAAQKADQTVNKPNVGEGPDKAQKTGGSSEEDKKTETKSSSAENETLLAELAGQLMDVPVDSQAVPEPVETETAPLMVNASADGQAEEMQQALLSRQAELSNPTAQEVYAGISQNQGAAGEAGEVIKEAAAVGGKSQAAAEQQPEPVKTEETVGPKLEAQQSKEQAGGGAETFSDLLKGHAEQLESMGNKKSSAAEAAGKTDQEQANQALEELRRNADGKGVDLTDRLAARQGVYKQIPVMNNAGSDIQTPVAQQLKNGLEQGMKQDLQEFTIRLKPEGLGEIVVHMASAGGRTTVSLAVSNPETEKLVNSQMMSLKEMLEPLHAEVESVCQNSQGGMEFAGSGQEMFKNQNRQAQTPNRGRRGLGRQQLTETDIIMQETERMTAQSSLRKLYAYV